MTTALPILKTGDLFCGAGGFSKALYDAAQGRGFAVRHFAVNHWSIAIESHTANLPDATHYCQDVETLSPSDAVPGRRLHILTAAPACTHHSNARGGKPMNDQMRDHAWVIVDYADEVEIDELIIENVPEFRTWGELDTSTKRPKKEKRGVHYLNFLQALRDRGFSVEDRVINCADYGDAQTRKRLFIRASKHGAPRWPEATHASPKSLRNDALGLFDSRVPWLTARNEVIDWSLKGRSMFDRKKPLAEKTYRRAYVGFAQHGGPGAPIVLAMLSSFMRSMGFSVPDVRKWRPEIRQWVPPFGPPEWEGDHYRSQSPDPVVLPGGVELHVSGFQMALRRNDVPRTFDEPTATVSAQGTHLAIVEPHLGVFHSGSGSVSLRALSVDEPVGAIDCSNRYGVTEAVILPHPRPKEEGGSSIDSPLRTVTGTSSDFAIAEPIIVGRGGSEYAGKPRSIDHPLGTVVCDDHKSVCEPVIVNLKASSTATPVDSPTPTQTTRAHQYLAEPVVVPQFGGAAAISVDGPIGTVTTTSRGIGLAEPVLLPHRVYGLDGGDSIDDPVRTIRANNGRDNALAEPVIVPQFGERGGQAPRCHSVDAPLPTTTSHGSGALVEPVLVDVNHGTKPGDRDEARRSQTVDAPLATVTTSRGKAMAFLIQYNGTSGPQSIDDPLGTVPTKDRFLLVWIDGTTVELDVLIRMLQPEELKRAFSLPGYKLAGNKGEQVKQIGNAVPRRTAKALVEAAIDRLREVGVAV